MRIAHAISVEVTRILGADCGALKRFIRSFRMRGGNAQAGRIDG